jgi:mercuric reductase
MIRAVETLHQAKAASRFAGVRAESRITDWRQVVRQKDELVSSLRQAKYIDILSSWEQAAKLFKDAVTQEQWVRAAKGTRAPLGKLVSRRLKSRQYTEKLPGALDGKYVVIQFDTVFAP